MMKVLKSEQPKGRASKNSKKNKESSLNMRFPSDDSNYLSDDYSKSKNMSTIDYRYLGEKESHVVEDAIVSSSQGVLVSKIMEFFKFHCIFYDQKVRLRDIEVQLHDPAVITVTKSLPSASISFSSPAKTSPKKTLAQHNLKGATAKNINYSSNTQIAAREKKLQQLMLRFNNLFLVSHMKPLKWFTSITFTEGVEEDRGRSTSISRYEFMRELRILCETVHLPHWEDNDARLLFDFIINPVCGNNHFTSLFLADPKLRDRRMHEVHFKNAMKIYNLSTKKVHNMNAISSVVLRLGEHASSHGLRMGLLIGDRTLNSNSLISKDTLHCMITALITNFIRTSRHSAAKSWLLQKYQVLKDADLRSVISENTVSSRDSFEDVEDSSSLILDDKIRFHTGHITTSALSPTTASMQRLLDADHLHMHVKVLSAPNSPGLGGANLSPVHSRSNSISHPGQAGHPHHVLQTVAADHVAHPHHHLSHNHSHAHTGQATPHSTALSITTSNDSNEDASGIVNTAKATSKTHPNDPISNQSSTYVGSKNKTVAESSKKHIIPHDMVPVPEETELEAVSQITATSSSSSLPRNKTTIMQHLSRRSRSKSSERVDEIEDLRRRYKSLETQRQVDNHLADYEEQYKKIFDLYSDLDLLVDEYGKDMGLQASAHSPAVPHTMQRTQSFLYSQPTSNTYSTHNPFADSDASVVSSLAGSLRSSASGMSLSMAPTVASLVRGGKMKFKSIKRGTREHYYQSLLDKFDHSVHVIHKQMMSF